MATQTTALNLEARWPYCQHCGTCASQKHGGHQFMLRGFGFWLCAEPACTTAARRWVRENAARVEAELAAIPPIHEGRLRRGWGGQA